MSEQNDIVPIKNKEKAIDNIDLLLSMNRNELVDLIRRASYIEMFKQAASNKWQDIYRDRVNRFKQTEDNKKLIKQRDEQIKEEQLRFKKETKKINRLKLIINVMKHKKILGLLDLLMLIPEYFVSFILVFGTVYLLRKFHVIYTDLPLTESLSEDMLEILFAVSGVITALFFIGAKIFRKIKLTSYERQLVKLDNWHIDGTNQLEKNYEKNAAQMAQNVIEADPVMLKKYRELRSAGIESASYRLIFPENMRQLAKLQAIGSLLEDGTAENWKEALQQYRSELGQRRILEAIDKVSKQITKTINSQSQSIVRALNDIKVSNENGTRMLLRQQQEIQSENYYNQLSIIDSLNRKNN